VKCPDREGRNLSPCVEHREESDLRPQMLGIGRNGAQCLAGRPEQNVVDDILILKGNGCDWLRHREDHMEILSIEKLGSTIIQPLGASQRLAFWAVAIRTGNGRRPLPVLDEPAPRERIRVEHGVPP
jgi:hypothetical protein